MGRCGYIEFSTETKFYIIHASRGRVFNLLVRRHDLSKIFNFPSFIGVVQEGLSLVRFFNVVLFDRFWNLKNVVGRQCILRHASV